MLPILSSSSLVHFQIPDFFCSISSFSFQIISKVFLSLVYLSFYCLQFLSNLPQYFSSYCLSNHPNSFFTINCPSSSFLLNVLSFLSCCFISSISCWYFFSNSLTTPFVFSKFSIPFQVLDLAVNPFYCTKYLFFSLIHYLFSIFSTFYFSSPLIITGAGCFFLYPSTCPMYLCILLTFTTGCILIVLGNSNSTAFVNIIFFTL